MHDRSAWHLLLTLLIIAFCGVAAYGPWAELFGDHVHLADRLQGPSHLHPLGTDLVGRDLLVRLSAAFRLGVLPLWLGVAVATGSGLCFALLTLVLSNQRHWSSVFLSIESAAAVVVSIPVTLTAFAWAGLAQEAGLKPVLSALTLVFCLRTYLQVLNLNRRDRHLGYWTAHAALGGHSFSRIWHYGICSAWRSELAASLAFHLRAAVAIEASLSYLGFGIQEPAASFGNMLAAHFELYLKGDWPILAVIVVALLITGLVPSLLKGFSPTALSRSARSSLGR